MSGKLTVQRTVFIKHHVWYLSLVLINGKWVSFWSHHDRTGMKNEQAKIAFEQKHYAEVMELTKQHLQGLQQEKIKPLILN